MSIVRTTQSNFYFVFQMKKKTYSADIFTREPENKHASNHLPRLKIKSEKQEPNPNFRIFISRRLISRVDRFSNALVPLSSWKIYPCNKFPLQDNSFCLVIGSTVSWPCKLITLIRIRAGRSSAAAEYCGPTGGESTPSTFAPRCWHTVLVQFHINFIIILCGMRTVQTAWFRS